jgi:hypothetical protein
MSKTIQASKKASEPIPSWQLNVDYVETCNCDYGCPCNFSGFPTYGFCRALVFYQIRKGSFGDTRLNGLSVILAASWPKAIHEGDGTQRIYVSKEASKAQLDAIEKIWYGKAKGNGPFAIFASVTKYFLDPVQAEIKFKIDGKRSSFSVPGVLDVQTEPFKNPVTGEESDTEIHLAKGFIFQKAKACRTKVMRIVSPNLSFDDSGKNAFVTDLLTFKGP